MQPETIDLTAPVAESTRGAQSIDVGPLDSNATYVFVVRAVDEAGNVDDNSAEGSLPTLVSLEKDVQPIFERACLSCHNQSTGYS
jgi:hypothetical protein